MSGMLVHIIGGIVIACLGAACCYYSYQLVSVFGRNAWMETNLGGTRNGIVILGLILMVIGILIMFGVVDVKNPADQIHDEYGDTFVQ